MNESIVDLLARAAALKRDGRRVIACLLVKARGSTPQSAGALMLVDDAANTWGTVGGGCVEAEIRRQAMELLESNSSGLLRFKLDHDYGWDDGLICGGTIEMAVAPLPPPEVLDRVVDDIRHRRATSIDFTVQLETGDQRFTLDLPPRERLYVAGAGHVGQALARLALPLEFDVTLFDDREDLLRKFAPAGCASIAGDIAESLKSAPFDDRTFAVIVTRGHRHDEQALAASVNRGAAYVGMIGSRRKVKLIVDDLAALGVSAAELQKVHAPIGLGIGAVTVEEIAISIVAELIQVRRTAHASPVRCQGEPNSQAPSASDCQAT
jgi:xanthine dehydrogenase accessory factor